MNDIHQCPIHKVPFKRFEKGGQFWYSHKDGDKWCTEKKAEAGTTVIVDKPEPIPSHPELNLGQGMSKNDWAEKDRVTRKSIETQVAIKAVVDLAIAGKLPDEWSHLLNLALLWCNVNLSDSTPKPYPVTPLKPKDVSTPIKEVEQAPTQAVASQGIDPALVPKAVGQLYNWMRRYLDKKVLPRDFALSCGVSEEQLKSDVPSAYKLIKTQNPEWKDYPD